MEKDGWSNSRMWVPRQCHHHTRVLGHLSHPLTHGVHGIAENELRAGQLEVIALRRAPTDVGIGRRQSDGKSMRAGILSSCESYGPLLVAHQDAEDLEGVDGSLATACRTFGDLSVVSADSAADAVLPSAATRARSLMLGMDWVWQAALDLTGAT